MDDKMLREVHIAMLRSVGEALSLLGAAIARRSNAAQLAVDLRALMAAGKHLGQLTGPAWQLATELLAAVDAEALHQKEGSARH